VPTSDRYPAELRERAVRMVLEARKESGRRRGAVKGAANDLEAGAESLRRWAEQAEIDGDQRPGTLTADAARTSEFEREIRELTRANKIMKAASAFFAREPDPRLPG
jgi:transposase